MRIASHIMMCAFVVAANTACGPAHNFSHLEGKVYLTIPLARTSPVRDEVFSAISTFALLPLAGSESRTAKNDDPILEQHVLYQVAAKLEHRGYRLVENVADADCYVAVLITHERVEKYVPPTVTAIPTFAPGEQVSTRFNYSGSLGGKYIWGSGTMTGQTEGRWELRPFVLPGSVDRFYRSTITVIIAKATTDERVWHGITAWTSHMGDMRIGSLRAIGMLLDSVPPNLAGVMKMLAEQWGFQNVKEMVVSPLVDSGALVLLRTTDGNEYFPAVSSVEPGSIASKAGLLKNDMIIAIEGRSCRNVSGRVCWKVLKGPLGSRLNLRVRRLTEERDIELGFDRAGSNP